MVKHIVLFRFKEDLPEGRIDQIDRAFQALPREIEEISAMEWGTCNSPENLNKGFTHAYVLSFPSEKERDIYLPHRKHRAFTALLEDAIDDVLVFDYNVI